MPHNDQRAACGHPTFELVRFGRSALPSYLFGPWHDFYILLGTAAATLVGLMFVAASVGTSVFTLERQDGLRTFLSPTVVAFSVVLATSLITVLPVTGGTAPGLLLIGIGLLGMLYSALIWRRMARVGMLTSIDLEDRVWYTAAPAAAYAVIAAAGALLAAVKPAAFDLLASGVGLLLLAGLRNAWDMTTWAVLRRRD